MKLQNARYHFVGVGGIGMCGLAELLHNMGAKVSGSDLGENANTERLSGLGVKVFKGHQAAHVGDADVVVYSSAIPDSNPEIKEARMRKVPLIPRAEALAEIMRLKRGIAVAGTHGKTTTTSLISSIFYQGGLSPTILVGGRVDILSSTAHLGEGEWMIAEADESDGSFHKLSPEISIITNIDADHLDFYKTFDNVKKAFYDFALRTPFYGLNLVCGDDVVVWNLFKDFPKRVLFYGFDSRNDFVIQGSNSRYTVMDREKVLWGAQGKSPGLDLQLSLPGRHNALNASAAAIVSIYAGVLPLQVQQGLQNFKGVDRRFHFKGESSGVMVYDDYGHHPTEVRATLQAFREKFPDRRLVVFFQPHRYSRTRDCWEEFKAALKEVDVLCLGDIYPAGEIPLEGIHSEKLFLEIGLSEGSYIRRGEKVNSAETVKKVSSHLKNGDLFVTLGAGDGWKLGVSILERLQGKGS